MEGGTNNVQQMMKQVSKFDGKKGDDFLEWSSMLRISRSLYKMQSSKSYKCYNGRRKWTTIRRPPARLGTIKISVCAALTRGGSRERR